MRQVPCLRDAGSKMQQAVLDIITSLKTIAEGIKEMSTLAGSASRDSSSFLEKLEVPAVLGDEARQNCHSAVAPSIYHCPIICLI